ncbi:serine/threonine-protein kinase SMG1 [Adelges cooleyi]|uniref:serine/threonine-protein kinase SMG1 n=1 Tax=Adelges cooleyi TaxID=133065 RepID=UPI00217FB119|nr:serine/threonine-protein kinase SMG1 [Adelges cooleyi]
MITIKSKGKTDVDKVSVNGINDKRPDPGPNKLLQKDMVMSDRATYKNGGFGKDDSRNNKTTTGTYYRGNRFLMKNRSYVTDHGLTSRRYSDDCPKKRDELFESNKSVYYSNYRSNENYSGNNGSQSEDSKISKILRKMVNEEDTRTLSSLCNQLQEAFLLQENRKYIRRATDVIIEYLYGCLQTSVSSNSKCAIAKCLGKFGHALQYDCKRYIELMFIKYNSERNKEIKTLIMLAFYELSLLDKKKSYLENLAPLILENMHMTLESIDSSELITITADVAINFSDVYCQAFEPFFKDTVDILVGWHIDTSQSIQTNKCISNCIYRLSTYWTADMSFTLSLLEQLLDDMSSISSELEQEKKNTDEFDGKLDKILAFIRVFCTVAESVGEHLSPKNSSVVSWSFMSNALMVVIKTLLKCMNIITNENIVEAANNCVWLILDILQCQMPSINDLMLKVVELQMSRANEFSLTVIVSMFRMISKVIKEGSTNLSKEFIELILCRDSRLRQLRFVPSVKLHDAYIALYQSLLSMKNVSLVLIVYRYITGDLEKACQTFDQNLPSFCSDNPFDDIDYTIEEASVVFHITLKSLTVIANDSNSIIGMWALQPSIFELLSTKLDPTNININDSLRYSLIYLLYSHCKKHSNFIANSSLITAVRSNEKSQTSVEINSHKSGNLVKILNMFEKCLKINVNTDCKQLILKWIYELLVQADSASYLNIILMAPEVIAIIHSLVYATLKYNELVLYEGTARILNVVLGNPTFCQSKPVLIVDILDLCLSCVNLIDAEVNKQFYGLIHKISLFTVVHSLSIWSMKNKSKFNKKIKKMMTSHMRRKTVVTLHTEYFKNYMCEMIEPNSNASNYNNYWLLDVVNGCSVENETGEMEFLSHAQQCRILLYFWVNWEAASFCVTNRLRTPFGKPNSTFRVIEGGIKSWARDSIITLNDNTRVKTTEGELNNLKHTRNLVAFIECLEKSVSNAIDGTATALPAAQKPVRHFFHTNRNTCYEWNSTIRSAMLAVSLNSGLSSCAIRHGHHLIQHLAKQNELPLKEFILAIVQLAWAYCRLRESDCIYGLYVWCKEEVFLKLPFLNILANQASGKFEEAAESYVHMLTDSSDKIIINLKNVPIHDINGPMEVLQKFIAEQLKECYLSICDWKPLIDWTQNEENILSLNCKDKFFWQNRHISATSLQVINDLEEGNCDFINNLVNWDLNSTSKIIKTNWNCYDLINEIKSKLVYITLKANFSNGKLDEKYKPIVEDCHEVIRNIFQESLTDSLLEYSQEVSVLSYAINSLLEDIPIQLDLINEINIKSVGSNLISQTLFWTKILENKSYSNHKKIDSKCDVSNLYLKLAVIARKEGNVNLATRGMLQYLRSTKAYDFIDLSNTMSDNKSESVSTLLQRIGEHLVDDAKATSWPQNHAIVVRQFSKLVHRCVSQDLGIEMCMKSGFKLLEQAQIDDNSCLKEQSARMLITLGKWLNLGNHSFSDKSLITSSLDKSNILLNFSNDNLSKTGQLIREVIKCDDTLVNNLDKHTLMIGQLLRISVSYCPTMAKAWNELAGWCYKLGRKVVDEAYKRNTFLLNDSEMAKVDAYIPSSATIEDREKVYEILNVLTSSPPQQDDDDIGSENIYTTEMIEYQLQNVLSFEEDELAGLIDWWRKSHSRIYGYYQLSAQAYFKFLQLCDNHQEESIAATLRLLRLTVKHALELQGSLEEGLSNTPTKPWRSIIPQLFSRLSHPEPYVRRTVSELLCRLAIDVPHLITFPAVVGSDTGLRTINEMPSSSILKTCKEIGDETNSVGEDLDRMKIDEDDDEDLKIGQDEQAIVLEDCFHSMVNTLSKQAGEMITEVRVLVSELRRITLLWDELWLGTLTQRQADIGRRISQLETELCKTENHPHLSDSEKEHIAIEKYTILLRPILFIFEQLHAITSIKAETPHEEWFQDKFGSYITHMLDKLRRPADSSNINVQDVWKSIKNLQSNLQARISKRGSYSLKMDTISPVLANLKDTKIAMPGVERVVTVASINNSVAILPTFTKPKKLIFYGSDGKVYTYLFKGLEDLHLDERIMQLLCITNTLLSGSCEKYRAHHYPVIPLGPRSGLISWVDGVVPIFMLYKRWQQRQASNNDGVIMRPSELFNSKLAPLLKENGISNMDSRKEWPLNILKEVLISLMNETPKNLLSNELWTQSVDSGSWWQSTSLYATSLAVMSIIGYIIGLGDRHLDNVLVNLQSGEVVHIDYNVCFEKGKTLRVPEKVPFRLTQNLKEALGVTGVEGKFRLTCEQVMKVLRKNKETLLTLLEAFVYDPLIDWTPGNETGYTGAVYGGGRTLVKENRMNRRQLEKEITLAMLNVRITEAKHDWLDNRENMLASLSSINESINNYLMVRAKLQKMEEGLAESHQLMALVKEAEASPVGQHPLYKLPERYFTLQQTQNMMIGSTMSLRQKIEDCDSRLSQYEMAMHYIAVSQIRKIIEKEDSKSRHVFNYLLQEDVKEFLQNAGQTSLIEQCMQSNDDITLLCRQQNKFLTLCLRMLYDVQCLANLFPKSHVRNHRLTYYRQWLRLLVDCPTIAMCEQVKEEHKILYLGIPNAEPPTPQTVAYNMKLQQTASDASQRTAKLIEQFRSVETEVERMCALLNDENPLVKFNENSNNGLEIVIATNLCAINKKFLMMETSASNAGTRILDMTSKDGEWILVDMYMTTTIAVRMVSSVLSDSNNKNVQVDTDLSLAFNCLRTVQSLYCSLQKINFNFVDIIMPETIKKLCVEEPSTITIITELNNIINNCTIDVNDLIEQLNVHLRHVIMGMKSPNEGCQTVVRDVRNQFYDLIKKQDKSVLTQGEKLLVGFYGLFEDVTLANDNFIKAHSKLKIPTSWKTVDQIREAKSLLGAVMDDGPCSILDDIMFLKALLTMKEVFNMCAEIAINFGGRNSQGISYSQNNEEVISKPVRCFAADYLTKRLLGLFSHTVALTIGFLLQHTGFNINAELEKRDIGADSKVPLEELCKKCIEEGIKVGKFNRNQSLDLSSVLTKLEDAWRKSELRNHLRIRVHQSDNSAQRLALQYAAHCWLHAIPSTGLIDKIFIPDRTAILTELNNILSPLAVIQSQIMEQMEHRSSLMTTVEQRLKWASGANPSVAEITSNFEDRMKHEKMIIDGNQSLCSTILTVINSLLQTESLLTRTSEAISADISFLQLVEDYQKACYMVSNIGITITPEEETLIKIVPIPQGPIEWSWLNNAVSVISDNVQQLIAAQEPLKSEINLIQKSINDQTNILKSTLNLHNKIISDVRVLLKSLSKIDNVGTASINYLAKYCAYLEQMMSFVDQLTTPNELTMQPMQILLETVQTLLKKTPLIYDDLLTILGEKGLLVKQNKRPPLVRQDSICLSPRKGLPRDPHTGKAVQKCNAYAVSVWRRVRMKLEGRDPDLGRRSTVTEQVNWVINEATSNDNLALLYEGWTPWV